MNQPSSDPNRFRLQPRNFYWAIVDTHANDATIFMLPTSKVGNSKAMLILAGKVCDFLNATAQAVDFSEASKGAA